VLNSACSQNSSSSSPFPRSSQMHYLYLTGLLQISLTTILKPLCHPGISPHHSQAKKRMNHLTSCSSRFYSPLTFRKIVGAGSPKSNMRLMKISRKFLISLRRLLAANGVCKNCLRWLASLAHLSRATLRIQPTSLS
jgi:hypothetical protein